MTRVYQIKLLNKGLLRPKYASSFRLYPAADESYYLTELSHAQLKRLFSKEFSVLRVISDAKPLVVPIFPFGAVLHGLPPEEVIDEVRALALSQAQDGKIPFPVYLGRNHEASTETFIVDKPGGRRNYRWQLTHKPPKIVKLEDKLKKLKKRLDDPKTRFVVSLGGGGLRLFAHASVLKIVDHIAGAARVDELWGCSGGSIAGLGYAMGVKPEAIEREGYDLYNERYDLLVSPSKFQVLKNLAIDFALPGNPFMLKGFMDLQETIQNIFARLAKGKKVQIPFYCIAYNLHKKRNEVLTPLKVHKKDYGDLIHTVSAIDAVLASSSIPILYIPRVIKRGKDSSVYVDGGTAEEVPLVSIYRKWKIDQKKQLTDKKKLFILAVNLFPQVSQWKVFRNKLFRRLPFVDILKWSSHVADLMRRARIEDHLHILRDDPKVEVWELVLPAKGAGVLDPKAIPQVIATAHASFIQQLLAWEEGKPIKV